MQRHVQVYVDEQAIDETLVQRMAAAAGHPHAADAFLSMMLSPRGDVGLGKMAAAVAAHGTPICIMHGAAPAAAAMPPREHQPTSAHFAETHETHACEG